jgi:hypothetical protein
MSKACRMSRIATYSLRAAAGALTFRHGATLNLRLLDCHPGKTLSTVKNSARSARGNRKLMRKNKSVLI